MKGLSRSNLEYMRRFARAYDGGQIPQHGVGELPWGHITVLLDKVKDAAVRDWYATEAARHGWQRSVLTHMITSRLHERAAVAPSNFSAQLPAADSELAQQLTKDPYTFGFLGLTGAVAERDLENALMDHLQRVLLELGHGFAFAGRQYRFAVGGDEFAARTGTP